MTTLTNKDRDMKMTTVLFDTETLKMLSILAEQDETQPGNRSNLLRRLIREAYKKYLKKNTKDS